jgi:hypothetical protein
MERKGLTEETRDGERKKKTPERQEEHATICLAALRSPFRASRAHCGTDLCSHIVHVFCGNTGMTCVTKRFSMNWRCLIEQRSMDTPIAPAMLVLALMVQTSLGISDDAVSEAMVTDQRCG